MSADGRFPTPPIRSEHNVSLSLPRPDGRLFGRDCLRPTQTMLTLVHTDRATQLAGFSRQSVVRHLWTKPSGPWAWSPLSGPTHRWTSGRFGPPDRTPGSSTSVKGRRRSRSPPSQEEATASLRTAIFRHLIRYLSPRDSSRSTGPSDAVYPLV